MSLSNLDKNTLSNLFNMLNLEEKTKNHSLEIFKQNSNIYCQLNLISRQINNLKLEAINLIENFNINIELQKIECNFKKVPGKTYYLYLKNNNTQFLSLISPNEWSNDNIKFLDEYYFDFDYQFYIKKK